MFFFWWPLSPWNPEMEGNRPSGIAACAAARTKGGATHALQGPRVLGGSGLLKGDRDCVPSIVACWSVFRCSFQVGGVTFFTYWSWKAVERQQCLAVPQLKLVCVFSHPETRHPGLWSSIAHRSASGGVIA